METTRDAAAISAPRQRGDRSFVPLDHRRHLKGLDGIRGVAILMVFAFHYYPRHPHDPLALLASPGWLGVDLFFTLSGFLITGILYDTVSQPHYFRNFFARRALRLFPVYVVMVAVSLVVIYLGGLRPTLWAVPFFLYGANIVQDLQRNTGLGSILNLGHLWSLALEEQFYLVWTPMVFLLRTRRRILWGCLAGTLLSVSLSWLWLMHPLQHYLPYFELPTRLDSLLAGGALALLLRAEHPSAWLRTRRLYGLFAVCPAGLLLAIAVTHTSFGGTRPMIGFGHPAATIGFAAVCGLSIREGTWVNRLGNLSLLRTFGRYSYGLYLWHLLPDRYYIQFLTWFEAICPVHFLGRIVGFSALLAFNLGIAALSYHTIELTFLRMKKYFSYSDEQKMHVLQADQATTVNVA